MDSVFMEIIGIQMRRAAWYDYVKRRFDLVSFGDLADWIATIPGGVDRNEARRNQAILDFKQSIARGEFGPRDKRCIPWMPRPPRADMLGSLCLRLNYGQIVGMGDSVVADLWATSALCLKWLEARQIAPPPWMPKPPEPLPAMKVAEATSRKQERGKEKNSLEAYDPKKARFYLGAELVAQQKFGRIKKPDDQRQKEIMAGYFFDAPRDPVRKIADELWKPYIKNPRKPRKSQKNI